MYTILIVEDNLIVQTTIKEILLKQEKNMNILTSEKGKEGLEIADYLNKLIYLRHSDQEIPLGDTYKRDLP